MKLLPHEKLGITFAEYGALLGTRAMLANKAITYVPPDHYDDINSISGEQGVHLFNMAVACQTQECGSVSCIGGTMAMIMGLTGRGANPRAGQHYVNYPYVTDAPQASQDPGQHSPALTTLFMPDAVYSDDWHKLKPATVVKVIDHFLATGKVAWEKFAPQEVIKRWRRSR